MAEETLEQAGPAPESGRAKRPPPTIDLEATEVTTEPAATTAEPAAEAGPEQSGEPQPETASPSISPSSVPPSGPSMPPRPPRSPISPWVIAPFSGAVAAALVIAVGWMLGWPPVQAPSQVSAAAIEDLSARLAAVEAKTAKPASDPAVAARVDAVDKTLAALRADLSRQQAQSRQLAADVGGLKSAGHEQAAPVDLSAIDARLAKLEQTERAQGTALASETTRIAAAKPADDLPLRRVVAAALLDVAVRHGDPYAAVLATAKSLAPDPQALKPLDQFAATGVPHPALLDRELLALVPKLSPPVADNATTGSGIIDRLQAGAAKLVHIERTDAIGSDRGAVVARITAAALHNDLADARQELNALSPADRAPAQGWLDKVEARDAALAASRRFADDAMSALAKPAQ